MSDLVADSSAVLAFMNGEPGAEVVAELLSRSIMTTVNLTEVITRLLDLGAEYNDVQANIESLPFAVEPFDVHLAFIAGALRIPTRHLGLSLGDRACLALAQRLAVPALTADRRWTELEIGIEIQLIRH